MDGSGARRKFRLGLLEDEPQGPFGRSSSALQALLGRSLIGDGKKQDLTEHASALVDGAGILDHFVCYRRRLVGLGYPAHHDTLGLSDPDCDAVVKVCCPSPHPVGL